MTAEPPSSPTSPSWSSTTKLVIGLSFVGIVAALLIYFRSIIGPLLLAFILAYLLHPVVGRLNRATRLNWRMSVNLVFLIVVILLIALLTLSGFAVVQQIQSLIRVVESFVNDLPEIAEALSERAYVIGPFVFNFNQFDLQSLTAQLLPNLQSMVGRITTLVSTFAASAAITLGWGLFVLLVAYFLLAESGQVSGEIIRVEIPGYDADVRRLVFELQNIWNTFLRGQLVIFLLTILLYTALMTILGVRYALGIAILAGLARFIPYLGPLVVWIVLILVTLLQGQNYFGLPTWQYAILVVVLSVVLDQVIDNIVTPRFLGQTLGVHPAAVLVGAIVAANLIGIIGLLLAAPVLATMKLLGGYVSRKMLDLDPWPPSAPPTRPLEFPWIRGARKIRSWWHTSRKP